MHYSIRLLIASAISSIIGWLLIIIGNWCYSTITGNAKPPTNSDFTIINWTISLVLSGVAFVYAYMKITDILGE